nr:lysine-specific demethylase JMJ25-like [Tanacetum cinerariifolium]
MIHNSSNKKLKQQKVKPKVRLERKDYVLWLFTFNVSNHQDERVIILQMDGLAQPGTGEPGGQGTHGPVGLSTCWPSGASTHESGGAFIREPGGPSTHELGGLGSSSRARKASTSSRRRSHSPNGVRVGEVKISAKNKKNRCFNKVPPTVGSLSVARRVYKKKGKGKEVSAIEMYEYEELGGCGDSLLEFKRILKETWISKLEARAKLFLSKLRLGNQISSQFHWKEVVMHTLANREESDDNYMYWPSSKDVLAKDDLIRFRHHWTKGEPVIFRYVLEQTSGLSWEPMVMWRALCGHVDPTVSSKMSEVKTIDCLCGCE